MINIAADLLFASKPARPGAALVATGAPFTLPELTGTEAANVTAFGTADGTLAGMTDYAAAGTDLPPLDMPLLPFVHPQPFAFAGAAQPTTASVIETKYRAGEAASVDPLRFASTAPDTDPISPTAAPNAVEPSLVETEFPSLPSSHNSMPAEVRVTPSPAGWMSVSLGSQPLPLSLSFASKTIPSSPVDTSKVTSTLVLLSDGSTKARSERTATYAALIDVEPQVPVAATTLPATSRLAPAAVPVRELLHPPQTVPVTPTTKLPGRYTPAGEQLLIAVPPTINTLAVDRRRAMVAGLPIDCLSHAARPLPEASVATIGRGVGEGSTDKTVLPSHWQFSPAAQTKTQQPLQPVAFASTGHPVAPLAVAAAAPSDRRTEQTLTPELSTAQVTPTSTTFAPVAEPALLDLGRDDWPTDMMTHIEQLRDAANSTDTRIRLSPDMLGNVDIDVRQDGDTLHVRFSAEQAQTRTLLQDAQPRLAEAAEARGLRLGGSTVDAGAQGQHRQPTAHPAVALKRTSSTIADDGQEPADDARIA